MKKDLTFSLVIFLIVGIGSLLSRIYHLYDVYWFTDIVLHTLSGAGFGFFWLFLERGSTSRFVSVLGCMSFAVFGSVLWEFGEFLAWRFVPLYGPFYSPNLFDTLGDIACSMTGGLMSALTAFRK